MAMGSRAILAVVAMAALAVQLAAAVDHKVGGTGAWDASGTNYNAWCAKQAIKQGDSMTFKYSSSSHDLTEVTKAGYDACSGANPIKSYNDGATTIKFAAPGKRYFICSIPGHCAAGMKLEVAVAAAAATPAPGAGKTKPRHQRSVAPTPAPAVAPEPTSSTDEMPNVSTPTAAPAPKSSDAATIVGGKAVVGLAAAVVAMALAM